MMRRGLSSPLRPVALLMMLVTGSPVVADAVEPKTIVTITFAQFALIFISFWWEVAGWLDDKLLLMTYNSITDFTKSVNDGWIMNIVLGTMYIVFPLGWFAMMGWTGVRIGDLVSQGISKAGNPVQDAGAQGPKAAEGAAKAVVTKGKSLMK